MADISASAVNADIPLAAGKIAPLNPLQQVGDFARTMGEINQLKLFPIQQQAAQLGLAQRNNQAVYGSLVPLLADPSLSMQRITQHLGGLENSGLNTQPIVKELTALPYAPGSPEWQGAVKTMIASRAQVDPNAMVAQAVGSPVDQDTGLAINSGVRAPVYRGGGVTSGSSTQVFPSRSTQIQRVQGPPDAAGRPTTVPLGPASPPELTGLPMGPGRLYRDGVPDPLRNKDARPMPGSGAIPGQMSTGLSPAESAAQTTGGTNAAAGFQRISDEGNSAVAQRTILDNMLADLPNFNPGTGADMRLGAKKFIQTYWPESAVSGLTRGALDWSPFAKSIASQESFDKWANQLANAQASGSDARLAVNQGANPHSGLSPQGAEFVIRQLLGNTDYLAAQQRAAAMWPDQSNLAAFRAKFNEQVDPRVFQFNRLTDDQKSNYYYGIPEKERAKFEENYRRVKEMGLLP